MIFQYDIFNKGVMMESYTWQWMSGGTAAPIGALSLNTSVIYGLTKFIRTNSSLYQLLPKILCNQADKLSTMLEYLNHVVHGWFWEHEKIFRFSYWNLNVASIARNNCSLRWRNHLLCIQQYLLVLGLHNIHQCLSNMPSTWGRVYFHQTFCHI